MKTFLVFAAMLFLAATAHAAEFPNITMADLKLAIEAKTVTLVDANGTDSWKRNRIRGAIDFDANERTLATLLPKDKKALVVVYCCGDSKCPGYLTPARAVRALGYTNVKNLGAGIKGWVEAREPYDEGMPKPTPR